MLKSANFLTHINFFLQIQTKNSPWGRYVSEM